PQPAVATPRVAVGGRQRASWSRLPKRRGWEPGRSTERRSLPREAPEEPKVSGRCSVAERRPASWSRPLACRASQGEPVAVGAAATGPAAAASKTAVAGPLGGRRTYRRRRPTPC